jgi:hypothetical protein
MYLFYGAFCVVGFFAWWRVERRVTPTSVEPVQPVGTTDQGAPA